MNHFKRKRLSASLIPALLLLCLSVGTAACGDGQEADGENTGGVTETPAAATGLRLTPEEYPRVDGSTVTIPFSEAVAAAVMGLPIEEARLYILHNRTDPAYMNLIDGDADIVFATPPSEAVLAHAEQQDVELEVIPILRDGLVFFVNAKNPVDGLRLEEIVDIYSGKLTNWKELGGDDAEILAYQRPESSGSQTGMIALVMKETPLAPAPREPVRADMGGIIDAVAAYENAASAVGYSYYYYTRNMLGDDSIKYLRIDGVSPSEESIAGGAYPLVSDICMALRKD